MVTSTMPPRTRTSATNGHQPPGMRLSPTKPRRNGALIAVGVLLMVGCGLIAAVRYSGAVHRRPRRQALTAAGSASRPRKAMTSARR